MSQFNFNPADYCFSWTTDGWYEWDRKAAQKAAMTARNVHAKVMAAKGKRVIKSSMPGQLITRGGIGSGKPQIEMFVTVYTVTVI